MAQIQRFQIRQQADALRQRFQMQAVKIQAPNLRQIANGFGQRAQRILPNREGVQRQRPDAIRDLAGKRASMGLPGSATLLTTQALLGAYGIQGAVERVGVSPGDIAAKPVAGDVDAVLALSFHSEALAQAIARGDAGLRA